jgi:hypothetical protein
MTPWHWSMAGWRKTAKKRRDIKAPVSASGMILTETDDHPLDVYYGDPGFYASSNAMKVNNTQ